MAGWRFLPCSSVPITSSHCFQLLLPVLTRDARADGEPPAKRARSNTSAIPPAISSNTQSKLDTIMQLCEEKVNVAQQIYDLVDQRILRLDRNLRSFDTELIQERRHLELPDDPTAAAAALEAAEPKHKQRKPRKSGSSQLPAPPWAPGPGPPALEPDSGIPAAVDLGEPVPHNTATPVAFPPRHKVLSQICEAGMSVRSFSVDQDPEAAQSALSTLEQAFRTDPVHVYFTHPAIWANRAFTHSIHGMHIQSHKSEERLVSTPGQQAVAVWSIFPTDHQVTTWEILRHGGLFSMLYAVPVLKWAAIIGLGQELDARKKVFAKEHGPFLYMFAIACLPAEQGKGLGSSLMKSVTSRADELGLWAYLEATTEDSKRLYERHGFQTLLIYKLRENAPFTIWIMARPLSINLPAQ
ncbi:hypothetical protein WJX84_001440 [Apatococcus fuscideae]|uniref:N-acetyltransferase domain-containing protein n=1 Tax=Apatococcus fuscideae TaxID=2026836 RepID=A0AAW1T231_9CHLO